tara:strand:- start:2968 stop:4551 length:1584 start_codon:yes stop_codon:yes gene_type:complete
MNKYLILFAIIILYLLISKTEGMKSKVFLNTDNKIVNNNIKKYFNNLENVINQDLLPSVKKLNETTSDIKLEKKLILSKVMNKNNKTIWEKKYYDVDNVLSEINKVLKNANIDIIITKKELEYINSRRELVKTLPLLKGAEKITYENIKMLVQTISPLNLINIISINENIPVYLSSSNNMIVNNYLYHFTDHGIIKYKIRKAYKKENHMINGVLEATILNKINKFNSSTDTIITFRGRILQIKNENLYNLITNKKFNLGKALTKSNYWDRLERQKNLLLETNESNKNVVIQKENGVIESFSNLDKEKEKVISFLTKLYENTDNSGKKILLKLTKDDKIKDSAIKEVINQIANTSSKQASSIEKPNIEKKNIKKLLKEVIKENVSEENVKPVIVDKKKLKYILNRGPVSYLVYSNIVLKEDEFSSKINKVIKDNNLEIIGVIPKYNFYQTLEYTTLFVCKDNLYFSVKTDTISKVKDFKKNYGFKISKNLPNYLSCEDQKVLFNQMIKERIITKKKADKMLKKLKCLK